MRIIRWKRHRRITFCILIRVLTLDWLIYNPLEWLAFLVFILCSISFWGSSHISLIRWFSYDIQRPISVHIGTFALLSMTDWYRLNVFELSSHHIFDHILRMHFNRSGWCLRQPNIFDANLRRMLFIGHYKNEIMRFIFFLILLRCHSWVPYVSWSLISIYRLL